MDLGLNDPLTGAMRAVQPSVPVRQDDSARRAAFQSMLVQLATLESMVALDPALAPLEVMGAHTLGALLREWVRHQIEATS